MKYSEKPEPVEVIEFLKDISAVFQTVFNKDQNNIVFDLIDTDVIENMIDKLQNSNCDKIENDLDIISNKMYHDKESLTLRERFAGLAMQAIRSNPYNSTNTPDFVAEQAVKLADALIIELQKTI